MAFTARTATAAFHCRAVSTVAARCRSSASATRDGTEFSAQNRFADPIVIRRVAIAKRPVNAVAGWDGLDPRVAIVRYFRDACTERARNHWNANVSRDGLESFARRRYVRPTVAGSMDTVDDRESAAARLAGWDSRAANVTHIRAALTETVDDRGNATASLAGEECYVMRLNYCEKNPDTCQNGGKCKSLIKDDGFYRCECPTGYKGRNCEILPMSMMMSTSSSSTSTEQPTSAAIDTSSSDSTEMSMTSTIATESLETYRNSSQTSINEDYMSAEYSSEDLDNEA
uniref:EGF-like domain-containing protein n=1 Tax=Anopheles farauti TaxID=69004 RepID=A0A182QGA2_9DIPT